MSILKSLKKGAVKLLEGTPWPFDNEYFFLMPENVYEDFVKLAMKSHPNELFFYIIAEAGKSSFGKILTAKKIIESKAWETELIGPVSSTKRASRRRVTLPSKKDIEHADKMRKQDFLILCHTHTDFSGYGDVRNMVKGVGNRALLWVDVRNQADLVIENNIPLEKTFFSIFLTPLRNKKADYRLLYGRRETSILIIQASAKKKYSIITVGKNPTQLRKKVLKILGET